MVIEKEVYYPCSENKGADHNREADLRLFSHMQIVGFLMRRLIYLQYLVHFYGGAYNIRKPSHEFYFTNFLFLSYSQGLEFLNKPCVVFLGYCESLLALTARQQISTYCEATNSRILTTIECSQRFLTYSIY